MRQVDMMMNDKQSQSSMMIYEGGGGYLMNRRDHFLADVTKPQRVYPLNMVGKNTLKMNPRSNDKQDDIERTMKVSHVEEMPTKAKNYYQDLLKKIHRRKKKIPQFIETQSNGPMEQ